MTATTTATMPAGFARRLAAIDASDATAAALRTVADFAATITNEVVADEVRRLLTMADEYDGDAEEGREQLLADGFDPETML